MPFGGSIHGWCGVSLARYTVTPGGRIDTREELLAALDVAAELEHTLLVQYLFAATSCRKRPDGGFDERRVELVRDWEASLLSIAREEMVHLATVTKIAVAVGGAPIWSLPPSHSRRARSSRST